MQRGAAREGGGDGGAGEARPQVRVGGLEGLVLPHEPLVVLPGVLQERAGFGSGRVLGAATFVTPSTQRASRAGSHQRQDGRRVRRAKTTRHQVLAALLVVGAQRHPAARLRQAAGGAGRSGRPARDLRPRAGNQAARAVARHVSGFREFLRGAPLLEVRDPALRLLERVVRLERLPLGGARLHGGALGALALGLEELGELGDVGAEPAAAAEGRGGGWVGEGAAAGRGREAGGREEAAPGERACATAPSRW